MNTITFRRAQVDDHQAVYDINKNIYNGRDPIGNEKTYRAYLSKPYNFAYVAELAGQVISFSILTVQDSGKTLYMRFGRTKHEFCKAGANYNLGFYGYIDVISQHRQITSALYTKVIDGPIPTIPAGQSLLNKWALFVYKFDSADRLLAACGETTRDASRLAGLDERERRELLTNPSVAEHLFGIDHVLVDMILYKVAPENYRLIVDNEDPYVVAERRHSDRYASVSLGCVRAIADPRAVAYKVVIYARDADSAVAHFRHHVAHAARAHRGRRVSFAVNADARQFARDSPGRRALEAFAEGRLALRRDRLDTWSDAHTICATFPVVVERDLQEYAAHVGGLASMRAKL